MKTLFLVYITLSLSLSAQAILNENFNYLPGAFNSVQSEWTSSNGSEAAILDTNLAFDSYPSSSTGGLLNITDSTTSDYDRSFSSINSGKIYVSFLLRVLTQDGLSGNAAAGDYFIHLKSGSTNVSSLYIKKGSGTSDYVLGLKKKSGSTTTYLPNVLNIEQTYLIVLCYVFNTNSDIDDEIKIWINPALAAQEPAPDFTFTDSQTDASYINKICIRQGSTTPNAFIDGIRIAYSWSEAPLPVELISFKAEINDNSVILNWVTASEINNSGFEVERACPDLSGSLVSSHQSLADWKKIGFVKGNVNSTELKRYTFEDRDINDLVTATYRLKQVDLDGVFRYSDEIKVEFPVEGFRLYPNYPNPFNPVTKIKWMQPEKCKVSLIIYDILGNEVKRLINEEREKGIHETIFHADNLASEIYILVIKSDKYFSARRMQILK